MSFPKNPNSEQLFRSAFTQPTLSSSLLNQIKQHSIYLAIVKLVAIYVTLADENPRQAEASLSPRSSVASWPTLTNKIGRLSMSRRRSSILDFLPSVGIVVQVRIEVV